MRTISWMGDWACACGEHNLFRDITCGRCKQSAPCREWVRGRCKIPRCSYPHTPFDLPPNLPERLLGKKEGAVVRPAPGAVVKKGAAPAPAAAAAAGAPTAPPARSGSGGGGAAAPAASSGGQQQTVVAPPTVQVGVRRGAAAPERGPWSWKSLCHA